MHLAVSKSCGKALKNTNDQCSFDHKRMPDPHRPDFSMCGRSVRCPVKLIPSWLRYRLRLSWPVSQPWTSWFSARYLGPASPRSRVAAALSYTPVGNP